MSFHMISINRKEFWRRAVWRSVINGFLPLLMFVVTPDVGGQTFNFEEGDHGFVASGEGATETEGGFVYEHGRWSAAGIAGGTGEFARTILTSPTLTVGGRLEVQITHSFNFEEDWDSGHLELVVNGGNPQRAGVDIGVFEERGYVGVLPEQGTNPEKGTQVWTGPSSDSGVSRLVVQDLPESSEIALRFVGVWDEATLAESPNWIIEEVEILGDGKRQEPKTWIVDKDVNNLSARFSELQDAIDHARPGDTLLLMPSAQSYGNATINKSLTILGAGFGGADVLSLARHQASVTGILHIGAGVGDVTLSGLTIRYLHFLEGTAELPPISNVLLLRNHFNSADGSGHSVAFLHGCGAQRIYCLNNWIAGNVASTSFGVVEELHLRNNVIHGGFIMHHDTIGHAIVVHNVFPNENSKIITQSGVFAFNLVHRKTLSAGRDLSGQTQFISISRRANVYSGARPADFVWRSGTTFYDPAPHHDLVEGEVFTKGFENVVELSGLWWEKYVLKAESPAKGIAPDGSDAGIFGGLHPWDEEQMPPFPFVTSLIAPSIVTQGQPLTVEVEVQTNN